MSVRVAAPTLRPGFAVPGRLIGALALGLGTAVGIGAFVTIGLAAIVIPILGLLIVLAAAFPRTFVYVLLSGSIVLEPMAIDFTKPAAIALWDLPTSLKAIIPITTSPMELALVAVAGSLWLRGRKAASPAPPIPRITWAVPAVIVMGLAFGYRTGGDLPLAYNEARGLLFAMVVFFVAWRMADEPPARLLKVLIVSSTLLSVVTINRWLFYTRDGSSPIPVEFAYAHEDAVFFGIAIIVSGMCLLRAKSNSVRFGLILHMLLVLVASLVTGRRAGTLVFILGAATVAWLLFPKRPVAVLAVSIPVLLAGMAYLAVFWNQEYGALAQPARALRSQVDPSARDASSDDYRSTERYNVTETLKLNRVFGIGFGRPFAQFQPLPNLKDFWPLQDYTPHQNLLWLWLKMGIAGVAVMLGLWLVALKRCLETIRSTPKNAPLPTTAVILAACLLMYLAYAQIDQALAGTRAIAPLAVTVALCLRLRPYQPPAAEKRMSPP